MIVAPINSLNLVLHFFRQELNMFLLMPFTILVPNTYAFRPKRTASLYLVYKDFHSSIHSFIHSSWDKIFALFRNTKCFSLQKLIFNWCRCSLTCSYIVINIVVKCILLFVDIVIHSVIDVRFCYFIFVNKKSLMFITDINRIKSPVVDLLLKLLLRFVLTVFQVSCMLLLAILFPLKSSFDDNVYLTT